jgi:hypothetical protein
MPNRNYKKERCIVVIEYIADVKGEEKMKYKIHHFDVRMTHPKDLEDFLNTLIGEAVCIIPNVQYNGGVDFVLIVEKFKQ